MGVELRSIQRKFHTLMDEIKPQIRPRFVVWLDERLAEFKIKGRMELSETLEDPQWIKNYMTSKRESKAAAIRDREARDAGSSTGSVHPKVEAKSESSNGIAHADPDELEEGKEEKQEEDYPAAQDESEDQQQAAVAPADQGQGQQEFQLVEVKREQMEDDDDDDMIIVGETIAPPRLQQPYPSQYNPTRQMYSGFGRNPGPFQRKRQRFGAIPQRPTMAMSAGNRFKSSRVKPNFRSAPSSSAIHSSYPSHTVTSQSLYSSSPSSQLYQTDTASYPGSDTREVYDTGGGDTQAFTGDTSPYTGESLRIPPHLQAQAASLDLQQGDVDDYEVTESDMYGGEYDDESYDSSYLADTTDSSIIQYDEQGNVVIKGENLGAGDDSTMEPLPGTSEGASQDNCLFYSAYAWHVRSPKKRGGGDVLCACGKAFTTKAGLVQHVSLYHSREKWLACPYCSQPFSRKSNLDGHINFVHLKIRPYICPCGANFSYKGLLQRHSKKCSLSEYL